MSLERIVYLMNRAGFCTVIISVIAGTIFFLTSGYKPDNNLIERILPWLILAGVGVLLVLVSMAIDAFFGE